MAGLRRFTKFRSPEALLEAAVKASLLGLLFLPVYAPGSVCLPAAGNPIAGLEQKTEVYGGYNCLVFAPRYELAGRPAARVSAGRYPLILSLHGFSLRGNDLSKLRRYGLPSLFEELEQQGEPVLVVAPQLPAGKLKWDKASLSALLKSVRERYSVDPERIYVTGASLGAVGAYEVAAESANRVAAVVIISGPGDLSLAARLARRPIWIFHGDADKTVPLRRSEQMVQSLKGLGGAVKLTVLPGFGHSFNQASSRDVYFSRGALSWLLSQRLTAAPVSASHSPSLAPEEMLAWIRALTAFPHRRPGSIYAQETARYLEEQFKQLGLTEVGVDEHPFPCVEHSQWALNPVEGSATGLNSGSDSLDCYPVANSGFTSVGGIQAPLVYVGSGSAGDFARVDVRGKIVVADLKVAPSLSLPKTVGAHGVYDSAGQLKSLNHSCHFPSNLLGAFVEGKESSFILKMARSRDVYFNAQERGALGLICVLPGTGAPGARIFWPYDASPKEMPALYVGAREGARLKALARSRGAARLSSQGTCRQALLRNVSARLPGPPGSRTILITSHFDSPFNGAVEDASGIAQVLAQARYWSQVAREQRPGNLVFVACDGHFARGLGALYFAESHEKLLAECQAVLTLEHLPARECKSEANGIAAPTGRPQFSNLYVNKNRVFLGAVKRALDAHPPAATIVSTPPFNLPFSDCAGFVAAARQGRGSRPLNYASWISAPVYLIDQRDTPDKIDETRLVSTFETVRALVVESAK